MACDMCGVEKLSDEFPPETVTLDCNHAILACLRCTVKHVKEHSECPHTDCYNTVSIDDKQLRWFQAILDTMFKEYHSVNTPEVESVPGGEGKLYVTSLTGESLEFDYAPTLTVLDVMKQIQLKLGHATNKQKLLYNETELKVYKPEGPLATLTDFNVLPGARMYLVVMLYAIPEGFDHVVFDLFWGFPTSGQDYLDASCLAYTGQDFYELCDYSHRVINDAVQHSGDVLDDVKRIGHHTIDVHLKKIPTSVTHLFFTLSAWSCPNIAKYPNPSLKFYEASKPNVDLCKTTFTHAGASQAVVMCSVSRGLAGTWQIFESGKVASGNARNYAPLKETIRSLIKQGI